MNTGAIGKAKEASMELSVKFVTLPFSPAKEGPLSDLHKLNFGGTIARGFMQAKQPLVEQWLLF